MSLETSQSQGALEFVMAPEPSFPRTLLEVGHTYQPPRDFALLSQTATDGRADIVSFVNDQIFAECYKPVLIS